MPIANAFLAELGYELPATRRLLERVPDGRGSWKPHPKSSALGHLAQLVARMPAMMANIVKGIDLDLAKGPGYSLEPTETLLREFDDNVRELRGVLANTGDGDMGETWRLLYGGEVIDQGIRQDVLRNTINHFVHHRAQLTVYLRMNEIPLPCLYGPTADESAPPPSAT
jgi:uncharacterized damage-inducible protein DinB